MISLTLHIMLFLTAGRILCVGIFRVVIRSELSVDGQVRLIMPKFLMIVASVDSFKLLLLLA